MNLKELAFPIRVYWDLTPVPAKVSVNYKGICDEIAAMKFFTVNLLDIGVPLSNSCFEILERLKNEMLTVSLTVSPSALSSATIALLSGLKVKELLVEASAEDALRSAAQMIKQHKDSNMTIGASFNVTRENRRTIPDAVSFCLHNNITRLVFPMQRLTSGEACFYIGREEGQALTAELSKLNIESMKITIHDPFLWRIFYPDTSFPGGGCQAANSMIYIASDGNVYPCPSMPIALGNLQDARLKEILSSSSKKELVKSLHNPPQECIGCVELNGCMGGCSGRVFVLSNSLSLRDPACK